MKGYIFGGMTTDTLIALAALAGGAILQYIKTSNDLSRLKEQLRNIEARELSNDGKQQELFKAIKRIEFALVKAGFIDVE